MMTCKIEGSISEILIKVRVAVAVAVAGGTKSNNSLMCISPTKLDSYVDMVMQFGYTNEFVKNQCSVQSGYLHLEVLG